MPSYRVVTIYREYRTYETPESTPDREAAEELVLEGDIAMLYSKVDQHYVNRCERVDGKAEGREP